MRSHVIFASLLCFSKLTFTDALPESTPSDGSFENPPAIVRPRFRYWLPDASVDAAIVKVNIKAVGDIGAGGVEFLPFYNYGGGRGGAPPGSDWSTYDFGTPPFQTLFRAALEAHREKGLKMDFALGANQGQGVPASPDDEGLQWDLVPFSATVPSNGAFTSPLPGWGTGELISVVSALVVSQTNVTASAGGASYLRLVLKHDTLTDLSEYVSNNGTLSYQLPKSSSGSYRLFASYQTHTYNHNIIAPKVNPKTMFDNGSFTVDHFDARGALTVTSFWERYILTDGVKELLSEVGYSSWEDSMELLSNTSWSKSMPSRFQKLLGYNIKPYLPLITFGNNNINLQRTTPGAIQAVLDTEDQGMGYVNDYRIALANGYQEYLTTLVNWSHSYLGLLHSSQVSYNLPMDMEASIPYDDVPECESLQFRDNVDSYRQFSGTAYLAGRNVVSVELGAVFGLAFQFTLPGLLFAINRAASGGVNRVVIHGQSYTGNYTATTWPGYVAFGYAVSEPNSDKQPDWDHGLSQVLDYIGRIHYIQRQGLAKIDLAFYNRQSATDPIVHTLYTSNDLLDAGYQYAYLSPSNFKLRQAYVQNGVLGPEGPAYKAMIVPSSQNMTVESISYLVKYAEAGLPVILLGGDPSYYPSRDDRDRSAIGAAISKLKSTKNVHSVAQGDLLESLGSLGIRPQVGVRTNGTWHATWREDAQSGIDYAYVFGDTNVTTGEITVNSTKKPYAFNPWTGARTPLLRYKQSSGSTTIPLALAGNETITIAFTNNELDGVSMPKLHITDTTTELIDASYSESAGLSLYVAASTQAGTVELSSGKRVSVSGAGVPPTIDLKDWTLTAEQWEAPSDFNDAAVVAVKHNTTHHLESLVSWTQIPGLANASGVGYYQKTFTWPTSLGSDNKQPAGAYIKFTPVLHAITLWVNGKRVPPLDYTNPVADITPYLRKGPNELLAVVPTVMLNYLGSIQGELRNGGQNVSITGSVDNGLIGTASIVPYSIVNVPA